MVLSVPSFLLGINEDDSGELLSPAGWTFLNASSDGNRIFLDSSDEFAGAHQAIDPNYVGEGAFYNVITVDSITQGTLVPSRGPNITTPGTYIFYSSFMDATWGFDSDSFCNAVVSHVSLRALSDFNLGAELIANGGFSSGAGWTAGTGWTISGGKANQNGDEGSLTSNVSVTTGNIYKLSVVVSGADDETQLFPQVNDDDMDPSFPVIESNGLFTSYVASIETGFFQLYGSGVFSMDNVSLKKYSAP